MPVPCPAPAPFLRPLWRALGLFALSSLAACGGGGGGSDGGSTPTPDVPSPSVGTDATCGLVNFQRDLLDRINALRAAGATCGSEGTFAATTPITWNAQLTQAALGHAQDMATKNYFSHDSADGRSFADRITAAGYNWSAIGENIAAGYDTVDTVMTGWRNSDGHCKNLMNPGFTEMGVACVAAASSANTYRNYWVMDLGKPR